MNRGLILKAVYEIWPTTLLCAGLLFGFEALLSYVLPTYLDEFSDQLANIKWIRQLMQAMLGSKIAQHFGPQVILSFPWVHPVILATVWAHAIITCTRCPAGEVDRGTIDVLLGYPVSRWDIHRSDALVWVGSGLVLMAALWLGNLLGSACVQGSFRPDASRRWLILANMFFLYLAVGGLAAILSSLSDFRGRAMTIAFVAVLLSYLWTFLEQFWWPARQFAFLSVLYYYRPLLILDEGKIPVAHLSFLSTFALAEWLVAGWLFSRRDLCTV
ncbi:MAG: hypothetical protein KatS3mg105_2017 [Gemmatales bacterium]|nr:MAG: hypothetical protein KatS3mg105_2017 [Gemmatales bacterium]